MPKRMLALFFAVILPCTDGFPADSKHEPAKELASDEKILNWNDSDFLGNLSATPKDKPVLVLFWAPWCPICQKMIPEVNKTAALLGGGGFVVKVNTSENPGLRALYQATRIPMTAVFLNGSVASRKLGYIKAEDLAKIVGDAKEGSGKQ